MTGEISVHRVTPDDGGQYFFGYYDKCPFDTTGRRLLAHRAEFLDRLPRSADSATVGVVDLETREYRPVTETRGWNWQQGSMLQWLPDPAGRRVIFNDCDRGTASAVICDVNSGDTRRLPAPIYAVHPDGRQALTSNFGRMFLIRDSYGYAGASSQPVVQAPSEDGIGRMNLETGETTLLISIAEMAGLRPVSSMAGAIHWLDHATYDHVGARFCFIHRWRLADGGVYHRLYVANADGTGLECWLDSGYFSHFGWRPNGDLLGYGRLPSSIGRLRRSAWVSRRFLKPLLPIFHSVVGERSSLRQHLLHDHYLLFNGAGQHDVFARQSLTEDGHCTWSPDGCWVLTDTYPDAEGYRTLILVHAPTQTRIDIGRFFAVPIGAALTWSTSGMRCDLHPRWDRSGTRICIDSVHEGSRHMYVVDVSKVIDNFVSKGPSR